MVSTARMAASMLENDFVERGVARRGSEGFGLCVFVVRVRGGY